MYADVGAASAALPEGRVRCPVTVASGAGPPNAPFAAAERAAPGTARRLPNARFERCEALIGSGPLICRKCRLRLKYEERIAVPLKACGDRSHSMPCKDADVRMSNGTR